MDFPLFERGEDGQLTYVHQPFVAPVEEDIPLLDSAPEKVRGTHYDVVLNGVELGSGSLRNHRSDVQRKIFEIMGYSKKETEARFGFLLNALDAGAPPHGGFAFGYDRWAMLLAGLDNLRDIIAFPKTQRGQDLLMDAPTPVEPDQLDELGIRVRASPARMSNDLPIFSQRTGERPQSRCKLPPSNFSVHRLRDGAGCARRGAAHRGTRGIREGPGEADGSHPDRRERQGSKKLHLPC